jgi:hypothetical protein
MAASCKCPSLVSRMRRKCAPRDAVLNPRRSREKFEGRLLGHPTDLKAKAGGDKSMSEKQGRSEGVYDGALQDPRDKVKATLPESQSPAVEPHTHRYHALDAVPSRACRSSFAVRTLRVMGDVQRAHSRG